MLVMVIVRFRSWGGCIGHSVQTSERADGQCMRGRVLLGSEPLDRICGDHESE
jgi:hypothetical protein